MCPRLFMSICHIIGNHMSQLKFSKWVCYDISQIFELLMECENAYKPVRRVKKLIRRPHEILWMLEIYLKKPISFADNYLTCAQTD